MRPARGWGAAWLLALLLLMPAARAGSEAAERGRTLARAGNCQACHTAPGKPAYSGGAPLHTPFGVFHAPNITPDPVTGIGNWTREDFWRALHEGRGRDGAPLYPAFPYTSYTRVSRADSDALYAYLRTLAPVRRASRPHRLAFPFDQRPLLEAWRRLYFQPGEYRPDPARSAQWNRGAYLVQGLGHCDACHGARDLLGGPQAGAALGGGTMLAGQWYAPALDAGGGSTVARLDSAELAALLRTGVSRLGAVYGPMATVVRDSLQHLDEADVLAMAVYLKSLPPAAEAAADAAGAQLEAGARLYDRHCRDCHQGDGRGAPPAYPPLAGSPAVVAADPGNAIRVTLLGGFPPSTAGNPRPYGMPPFTQFLSDEDVAAVLSYLRQSWGNHAAPVTAGQVARIRGLPAD